MMIITLYPSSAEPFPLAHPLDLSNCLLENPCSFRIAE